MKLTDQVLVKDKIEKIINDLLSGLKEQHNFEITVEREYDEKSNSFSAKLKFKNYEPLNFSIVISSKETNYSNDSDFEKYLISVCYGNDFVLNPVTTKLHSDHSNSINKVLKFVLFEYYPKIEKKYELAIKFIELMKKFNKYDYIFKNNSDVIFNDRVQSKSFSKALDFSIKICNKLYIDTNDDYVYMVDIKNMAESNSLENSISMINFFDKLSNNSRTDITIKVSDKKMKFSGSFIANFDELNEFLNCFIF